MTKRVLDVGNCGPDHSAIRDLIQSRFDAEVVQTHGLDDTLEVLRDGDVDLVLVNRLLDRDHSEGLEVIRQMQSDTQLARVPVMMVTNYTDHQEMAVREGAQEGFGKLQLRDQRTVERLQQFLD